jgi:hypothetical protein
MAEKGNAGAYAAKMCMDYRGGGFNDWFLPAQDQLDTLFFYRKKIGGFSERIYWTSTGNGDNVWVQDFKGGEKGVDFPTNRHSVRSIRVF